MILKEIFQIIYLSMILIILTTQKNILLRAKIGMKIFQKIFFLTLIL